MQYRAFTTIGISIESTAGYVLVNGCEFNTTAPAAGSGRYDLNVTNASARVVVNGGMFRDSFGSGAGQINATCNLVASNHVYFTNNDCENGSLANCFQGSVLPALLKDNPNINPVGSVSVTVGASPYSVPTKPYPVTYYVSGGTVTSLAVGGVTLTGITSGPIRVPPQTAFTITHSGAPTVVGFGD